MIVCFRSFVNFCQVKLGSPTVPKILKANERKSERNVLFPFFFFAFNDDDQTAHYIKYLTNHSVFENFAHGIFLARLQLLLVK